MVPASATLSRSTSRAFLRVRAFPASSTFPVEMSRIGLMERREPRSAWALPIRPPFLRLSRVSSAPKTWVRPARSSTSATTWSAEAPDAASSAASSTCVPRPDVIERESMTRTSSSPSTALAAFWADCIVAERSEDRLMHTMASAPAAC